MINKATQDLMSEVPRRLAAVEKQLRDFKNPQYIGADTLGITELSWPTSIPITLAAGERQYESVYIQGSIAAPYMSEFGAWFYINTDNNSSYLWPDGVALNSDLRGIEFGHIWDPIGSDFTGTGVTGFTGIKHYYFWISNVGSSTKTIYLHLGSLVSEQVLSAG